MVNLFWILRFLVKTMGCDGSNLKIKQVKM